MAQFDIAENITGRNEGLYANNKADRGGETYAGIARNFWPKWAGWLIIDDIKKNFGKSAAVINNHAKSNTMLNRLISDFYKKNFWDVNQLDRFKDQQLANTVYDFGVNSGTSRAAKYLQDILGIKMDGVVGNQTINTVNASNFKATHVAYNCRREAYYRGLAKNPTQAQFLKSWLSRLKPYK